MGALNAMGGSADLNFLSITVMLICDIFYELLPYSIKSMILINDARLAEHDKNECSI